MDMWRLPLRALIVHFEAPPLSPLPTSFFVMKPALQKFESTQHKGVFFWAEMMDGTFWGVVSGGPGIITSEAFDDWFPNQSDAVDIARKLANGEL